MPWLASRCSVTRLPSTGWVKLGHPVPESNLSVELNSGSPVVTSTYSPRSWLSQNSFRNGGSVPAFCVTSYCAEVSFFLRSACEGFVYSFVDIGLVLCAGIRPLADIVKATNGAAASSAATGHRHGWLCFKAF